MATHIKRLSDSPCSNNCTEMSEEVEISFQCLCCKINNDKNLENLVEFDTVEELCAHLAVTHLQNFLLRDHSSITSSKRWVGSEYGNF